MQTDDPTFLAKALEYAWAGVLALVGVVWRMLHSQLDTMRGHQQAMIQANTNEIDRQRDNIAKIFDKIQALAERAEQRHLELLKTIHDGLNQKADK
jgi:hypothetical protein